MKYLLEPETKALHTQNTRNYFLLLGIQSDVASNQARMLPANSDVAITPKLQNNDYCVARCLYPQASSVEIILRHLSIQKKIKKISISKFFSDIFNIPRYRPAKHEHAPRRFLLILLRASLLYYEGRHTNNLGIAHAYDENVTVTIARQLGDYPNALLTPEFV